MLKLKRSQESSTLNLDCDNMTSGRGACISILFDMDPLSKRPSSYSVERKPPRGPPNGITEVKHNLEGVYRVRRNVFLTCFS